MIHRRKIVGQFCCWQWVCLIDSGILEDFPDEVYIDFANSRVVDHSGLEAIDGLAERYTQAGKTFYLLHLSEDCRKLLKRADKMIEVNVLEDPKYFVADDELA